MVRIEAESRIILTKNWGRINRKPLGVVVNWSLSLSLSLSLSTLTTACLLCSPHPVKPLSSSVPLDEKRQGGSSVPISVLEKLKSTMRPVHSTLQGQHHAEGIKALTSQDHAALYHLTHDELIALLLEREAELDKRGAELQKFECKVHDLEEYIDRLLVRIIEETPTMLQVPQGK